MGEEQQEHAIASEIIRAAVMPCSPEASAVLTLPALPFPPPLLLPCCSSDSQEQTAKQRIEDIVVSKKEEACTYKHMPVEVWTFSTLPTRLPVPPVQADVPRQLTDKCPPETMPRRPGTHTVNTRQPESLKATSRENKGRYLERATAYLQGCISRCSPNYNMLVLQA